MSIKEQSSVRNKYYPEAIRYMNNAQEALDKAGKEYNYYIDEKYVKAACGIAYSGVLKALDGYLILKEIPKLKKGKRKSKEYYEMNLATLDRKVLTSYNAAYGILHLGGYYEGLTHIKTIKTGLEVAFEIIE
mgnify:CR=1 FL=1